MCSYINEHLDWGDRTPELYPEIFKHKQRPVQAGDKIYYQVRPDMKIVGEILWFLPDGRFVVSDNPTTKMPQMDDSRMILKPEDEGKLFWRHPTPDCPIPIEAQIKMQGKVK